MDCLADEECTECEEATQQLVGKSDFELYSERMSKIYEAIKKFKVKKEDRLGYIDAILDCTHILEAIVKKWQGWLKDPNSIKIFNMFTVEDYKIVFEKYYALVLELVKFEVEYNRQKETELGLSPETVEKARAKIQEIIEGKSDSVYIS